MDADQAQASHQLPTVLVLASGRGERFLASGGKVHKLKALLNGKPVLEHTLDAVRASGLAWHLEDAGHPGMGDSIAAAVRATPHANGWLILPGDLPLIRPETICAVAACLQQAQIVVPVCMSDGLRQRGHPVGFSRVFLQDLMVLNGDQGAASILRKNAFTEMQVNDHGAVQDVDTAADLAAMLHTR